MPELMIGLAYNGTTGRLSVEIIKGSNFKNLARNKPPGRNLSKEVIGYFDYKLQHTLTSGISKIRHNKIM